MKPENQLIVLDLLIVLACGISSLVFTFYLIYRIKYG